jgi:hypothetical protein
VNKKILILDAESSSVLPFLLYYHSLNYKIFVGSPHYFPISSFSKIPTIKYQYPYPGYLIDYGKSHLINQTQIDAFISSLKNFTQKNQIKYVLSFSENTLIPISLNIKKLSIKQIYPKYKTIQQLHDKSLLFKWLKKIRIRSFSFPSVYSLNNLNFPCVVRPTRGMSFYHVYVCKDLKEVKNAINILKFYGRVPLIQEYINADKKFAFNLLVNKKGKIVRLLSSSQFSEKRIYKVIRELEKFFKLIKYFGFASPQFLIKGNELYLTEINPRLSYYFYGLDFGVNFPEAFHKLFVDGKLKVKKIFKFADIPKSFFRASKLYLNETKDFLPMIKSFEALIKDKFITILRN